VNYLILRQIFLFVIMLIFRSIKHFTYARNVYKTGVSASEKAAFNCRMLFFQITIFFQKTVKKKVIYDPCGTYFLPTILKYLYFDPMIEVLGLRSN
jgi:hypothetical protein